MSDYQLGTKNESTYGTRITVDTFHEILPGDPIAVKMGTIESQGLRPRRQVPFADRFQRYAMGAEGTRSLEVLTLGFEWWLQHMLGAVDLNADTPVSGVDQHVATLANLCGLSFTWQENVVMGACKNTDQAFTYGGGKISSWTLSGEVEGAVTLEVEVLFANYTKATALATASYADGAELLSWAHAAATIAGTAVPLNSWSVSCNNNLKDDRYHINGSGAAPGTARAEPVSNGDREVMFECEMDFTNLTQWDRSVALTRSAAMAAVVITCQGPAVITGSTYPELKIEIPALLFDEVSLGAMQQEMSTSQVKGKALDNGVDEPLTVTYLTGAA